MKRLALSGIALACIAMATVVASETESGQASKGEVNLEGIKCLMAAKDADASKAADYKDAKVYFCCGGCKSKFEKSPEKFAEKANHQLVATKQYKQVGCPMSGGDVDPEKTVMVAGTKVAFCCGGCQSKVADAKTPADAMKLVYSEKAFKKGFKKIEAEKE